ncbi:unnamed protein product [Auanema sp. JU1783]|nr:unnamed protein product [Auanema sp. JU1783]
MPSCPPVARCPQQVQPQIISCCSTCPCQKRKRNKRDTIEFLSNGTYILDENFKKIRKRDVLDEVVHVDAKCNSESLREIIIQNIDRVTSVAKKRIQEEAESQLQGRYNVICARGDFSYVTNTESFCQQTVGDVTCYVFKQLSSVVRKRLA